MANMKKPRREKKKSFTYSVTTKVGEAFTEYCEEHRIVKGAVVEKAIISYLKKKGVKV